MILKPRIVNHGTLLCVKVGIFYLSFPKSYATFWSNNCLCIYSNVLWTHSLRAYTAPVGGALDINVLVIFSMNNIITVFNTYAPNTHSYNYRVLTIWRHSKLWILLNTTTHIQPVWSSSQTRREIWLDKFSSKINISVHIKQTHCAGVLQWCILYVHVSNNSQQSCQCLKWFPKTMDDLRYIMKLFLICLLVCTLH